MVKSVNLRKRRKLQKRRKNEKNLPNQKKLRLLENGTRLQEIKFMLCMSDLTRQKKRAFRDQLRTLRPLSGCSRTRAMVTSSSCVASYGLLGTWFNFKKYLILLREKQKRLKERLESLRFTRELMEKQLLVQDVLLYKMSNGMDRDSPVSETDQAPAPPTPSPAAPAAPEPGQLNKTT